MNRIKNLQNLSIALICMVVISIFSITLTIMVPKPETFSAILQYLLNNTNMFGATLTTVLITIVVCIFTCIFAVKSAFNAWDEGIYGDEIPFIDTDRKAIIFSLVVLVIAMVLLVYMVRYLIILGVVFAIVAGLLVGFFTTNVKRNKRNE